MVYLSAVTPSVLCVKAFLVAIVLMLASHASGAAIRTVRVLAFGDSLTQGMVAGSFRFHPYALQLQKLFDEAAPSCGFRVQIIEKGLSGEQVLAGMQSRLVQTLKNATDAGEHYHWVLILAGINDVGHGATADAVFTGLKAMYHNSRQHGAQVLAMTLMEVGMAGFKPLEPVRLAINKLITENAQQAGVHLFDLSAAFPFFSLSKEEQRRLWSDDLHATAVGYDVMGQLIFDALKAIVKSPEVSTPQGACLAKLNELGSKEEDADA